MAKEFKLPDLGENIESADVVSVLVAEGDTVTAEQDVIEVETDKAVVAVPCPFAGKVGKIHVKEGDSIKAGAVLMTLEEAGDEGQAEPQATKAEAKTEAEAKPEPSEPKADRRGKADAEAEAEEEAAKAKPAAKAEAPAPARPTPARPAARVVEEEDVQAAPAEASPAPEIDRAQPAGPAPAGPATRRLARELGVDLHQVTGRGPAGRIEREDVIEAVRTTMSGRGRARPEEEPRRAPVASEVPASRRPAPAGLTPPGDADQDDWGPVRRQRLPKIRKTIAVKMRQSKSTAAHLTNFDDADITDLEAMRQAAKGDFEGRDLKLTTMPFVILAVARALRLHPMLNASLDMDSEEIIYKEYVNVGVAVDTERGLVVPTIRHADRKGIGELAQELAELAEAVRQGQFTVEDLRGGTFTISNLGSIGGTYSTPIINYPEVAILLLGRSRKLPVVMPDDSIQPRLMMPLSLSYDHRLVDGAAAARFLNEVKGLLESPGRLLLAP